MYRKRWDKLLRALGIPADFHLTPGGLRGGGAVAAYRRGDQVSEIQWRMRLQHVGTLAFYLQEVAALSVIPRLHPRARGKVFRSSCIISFRYCFSSGARRATPRRALTAVAGMCWWCGTGWSVGRCLPSQRLHSQLTPRVKSSK